jgi:hypothetical protein
MAQTFEATTIREKGVPLSQNFTLDNTTTKTKPILLASHNPRNYLSFTIFTMEAAQSRKSQGYWSISIWQAFLHVFLKAFGRFFDGF